MLRAAGARVRTQLTEPDAPVLAVDLRRHHDALNPVELQLPVRQSGQLDLGAVRTRSETEITCGFYDVTGSSDRR